MPFYIAQTYTGEERKAAERLTGLFPTWRHHLLPGYLFVEASAPPWPVRHTDGVIRLLPFSDRPTPIDNDVMAVLQETCRAYEQATKPLPTTPEPPIAGMARRMVAQLLHSAGFSVTVGSERVEPAVALPAHGRSNHGHDLRRAARTAAGA